MTNPIPELLLPAGNMDKMKYALAFGADAVYLGIPKFSLRARENGFKNLEQVAEAIGYVQKFGKKAYVTANIFAHNNKLSSFQTYIKDLLDLCQPDAWIMSDPGLIMLMKQHFSNQVLHISVQANTLNYAAVQFWKSMGAKRVIVSREITIKEIKEIHEACPEIELESFVHGAICMAYSGRCLISNYLASRDGNQGVCTNSCRWEYKVHQKAPVPQEAYAPLAEQFYVEESERPGQLFEIDEDEHGSYLMNSKDLCAIHCLGDLRDAGVCSFKVEGRSKSVYYAAMIARAYRAAIDDLIAGRPFNEKHRADIDATSNRGFIEGFLYGNPNKEGQEYQTSNSMYSTYSYSGLVRSYDAGGKLLQVEPKGLLKVGGTYELCLPKETIPLTIGTLLNKDRRPIEAAHSGEAACFISYPTDPGPFALIREKVNPAS